MSSTSDNFYLTLPSNACTDIFPDNSGGYYKTNLPQELKLDSNKWEVGLSEITYVANSWDNVREGENVIRFTVEDAETSAAWRMLKEQPSSIDDMIFAKSLLLPNAEYKISLLVSKPNGDTDLVQRFFKGFQPHESCGWKRQTCGWKNIWF